MLHAANLASCLVVCLIAVSAPAQTLSAQTMPPLPHEQPADQHLERQNTKRQNNERQSSERQNSEPPAGQFVDNPFAGLSQPDAARYRTCMGMLVRKPEASLEAAHLWRDHEGGAPAKHCLGAALLTLDRYAEAAAWFEEAASDVREGRGIGASGATPGPSLVGDLLAQAGNAWLLANDPVRAYKSFSSAIGSVPIGSPSLKDLYLDRAIAAGMQKNYTQAIQDLGQVLDRDKDNLDALLLRAVAYRETEQALLADADLSRIIVLDPESGDALLERGNLRYERGQIQLARWDWIGAVVYYPGTDLAEVALNNLSQFPIGDRP